MSVPKKRRTSSSVGRRRSHHALNTITTIKCPKCGNTILPHTACETCGTYRDREIVKIKEKTKSAK